MLTALEALSSVQSGGVAVAGTGPYVVTFQGPMGGVSQPPMTTSDANVTATHTSTGGVVPSYTLNGGSSVPLTMTPLFTEKMPSVQYCLPQSPPQHQYGLAGDDGVFINQNGGEIVSATRSRGDHSLSRADRVRSAR